MGLENLVKTGQLHPQPPDTAEIARRIAAAQRSLRDAQRKDLAPESRFDLAYAAIMHVAQAALRMKGFRLATAHGHHATAIQALTLALGYDQRKTNALDALRRKRNGMEYEADVISESMPESCVAAAKELVDAIEAGAGRNST